MTCRPGCSPPMPPSSASSWPGSCSALPGAPAASEDQHDHESNRQRRRAPAQLAPGRGRRLPPVGRDPHRRRVGRGQPEQRGVAADAVLRERRRRRAGPRPHRARPLQRPPSRRRPGTGRRAVPPPAGTGARPRRRVRRRPGPPRRPGSRPGPGPEVTVPLARTEPARRLARTGPVAVEARPEPPEAPRPRRAVRAGGEEALAADAITVRFGDLEANHEVSLVARTGMVTALIGPNGAGKTTFFNVLTGAVRPTAGSVRIFGENVGPLTPSRAAGLGVIRTFQNLKVLPRLTVLENVAIGAGRGRTAGLPATLLGAPP